MARQLTVTYRMSTDPPPPMPWSEYAHRVRREWESLLARTPSEPQVQRFLEQHPALVPGAHSAVGRLKSGHAPFPSALITQPGLTGVTKRTPDFLWIGTDSAFLSPVFVEIEAPNKRWLTKKGHQHHQLTEALHQIDEWEEWFDQPANRQLFYDAYQLPMHLRRRKWKPQWVLVYGRREEDPRGVNSLRARLRTESRIAIPYEHLEPDEESCDYLCVRRAAGEYVAVAVPPTVRLGPQHAGDWSMIGGKEKAASACTWMSAERRTFLAERFRYWDGWADTAPGLIRGGDVE